MKISVIIPTYKPGSYIEECLISLGRQTLSKDNFEVLVILNGCADPWLGYLRKLVEDLPDVNIKMIQTDVPGVSNARNIGLDNANGEYIAFVDDDDFLSPRYLESLLEKATPETVVLTDSLSFIDGTNVYDETYKQHQVFQRCASINDQNLFHARAIFNGPCMKLLPYDFVKGEAFDTKLANGEDNLFMFQISRHIKKIDYAIDAIYYRRYREHSAITRTKSFSYNLSCIFHILIKYTTSWIKSPLKYNFRFVLSRYAAEFKSLFVS